MERMASNEIMHVISRQNISRIAFKDEEYPYIAPFQYVYINGNIYFHFSEYGKKMRLLDEYPNVSVEVEWNAQDMSSFCFLILRGTLERVHDEKERALAINSLTTQGKDKFSSTFLAAHGFQTPSQWDTFTAKRAYVIVKLTNIVEIFGLKSPAFSIEGVSPPA